MAQNGIISLFKIDPRLKPCGYKTNVCLQTPGGCGALKIGAELIKKVEAQGCG